MKFLPIVLFAISATGFSSQHTERTATLILPGIVTIEGGYMTAHPAVDIVWDDDEPVAVDVALGSQPDASSQLPSAVGSWKIYYAGGKEVERPAILARSFVRADGNFVVKKGDRVRLTFIPNSPYILSKVGLYYAIAEFSGTFRKEKIRFTTDRRWFEITNVR